MVGGPFSGTYSPPSFARPCRTQWRKPTSSAHRPSTTRASERGDSAKLAQSRLDAGVARIKSGFDAPPASDSAALVLTKAAVLALLRCCACPGATVGHATRRTAAPRPADNTRLEMLRIANTERCQYSRANASLPCPAASSTYLSPIASLPGPSWRQGGAQQPVFSAVRDAWPNFDRIPLQSSI
jgi:hypothetical protein